MTPKRAAALRETVSHLHGVASINNDSISEDAASGLSEALDAIERVRALCVPYVVDDERKPAERWVKWSDVLAALTGHADG